MIYSYLNGAADRHTPNHGHSRSLLWPQCRRTLHDKHPGPLSNALKRSWMQALGQQSRNHALTSSSMSSRPNPSQIQGRRTLRKYVYVTTCTWELHRTMWIVRPFTFKNISCRSDEVCSALKPGKSVYFLSTLMSANFCANQRKCQDLDFRCYWWVAEGNSCLASNTFKKKVCQHLEPCCTWFQVWFHDILHMHELIYEFIGHEMSHIN